MTKQHTAWGVLWRTKTKSHGVTEELLCNNGIPILFRTREQAREWIDALYGYIRHRHDLRKQPHGWRMPRPVRVIVVQQAKAEI